MQPRRGLGRKSHKALTERTEAAEVALAAATLAAELTELTAYVRAEEAEAVAFSYNSSGESFGDVSI